MSIYKKRTRAGQTNMEGGYKSLVYLAPVSDFLSLKKPSSTAALGDKYKITQTHTFGSADGFVALTTKKHAVTSTGETTGDDGAKSIVYKFNFTILGDDAMTQEQLETMLNDDIIIILKDQNCINATDFVQFGDECVTPDFVVNFDAKNSKEGLKEWTVEGTVKAKRFFYSGTITEKPSDDNNLSALSLSVGTLSPAFAAGTVSYTASVANGITNITVTPTANDAGATITVNGTAVNSGAASGNVALSVGANVISVAVTAANGQSKTYTVTVTRAA